MKVCIPAADGSGLQSQPFGHFGSAPFFVVHDTQTQSTDVIANSNQEHAHGACQPLAALDGKAVGALVVGGIGARAIAKLNAEGIRVYRSEPSTVADNLTKLAQGKLEELTQEAGCQQHGGCSH